MDDDKGTVWFWHEVDGWSAGEAAWFWELIGLGDRVYDPGEQPVMVLTPAVTRRQFGRLLLDAGRERVRRLLVLASEGDKSR